MVTLHAPRRIQSRIGTALRRLRSALNFTLARIGGADTPRAASGAALSRQEVKSILVCRPNVKLGNTLLLSPLLAELHRQYPDAAIDVVSAYARAPQLLRGQPGVRRILFLTHKAIRTPLAFLRQMADIRRERYDLAIDPNPSSSTGRVTLWASRSRFRLGFSSRNQWLRLTHTFPAPTDTLHESVRPLLLLKAVVPVNSEVHTPPLQVHLDDDERIEGRQQVLSELARRNARTELVIGHLTGAAGAKALGPGWWKEFWAQFRALEPRATAVEFLGWKGQLPADDTHIALALDCPRKMAAAISAVDLFISADTGPMHLASATPTPTIGLFVTTDPERYRPRKQSDLSPVVVSQDPAQVARLCVEHLRRCRGSDPVAAGQGGEC